MANRNLLAVDRLYGAFPSRERLFEVNVHDMTDVVAFAFEQSMVFL